MPWNKYTEERTASRFARCRYHFIFFSHEWKPERQSPPRADVYTSRDKRAFSTFSEIPLLQSTMWSELPTVPSNTELSRICPVSTPCGTGCVPVFPSCLEPNFVFDAPHVRFRRVRIQNRRLRSCRQCHRATHSQRLRSGGLPWKQHLS